MTELNIVTLSFFLAYLWTTEAFPSGATVEACESLLPRHIHTSPKNASESPFFFYASASRYYPDSKRRKIKGKLSFIPVVDENIFPSKSQGAIRDGQYIIYLYIT